MATLADDLRPLPLVHAPGDAGRRVERSGDDRGPEHGRGVQARAEVVLRRGDVSGACEQRAAGTHRADHDRAHEQPDPEAEGAADQQARQRSRHAQLEHDQLVDPVAGKVLSDRLIRIAT